MPVEKYRQAAGTAALLLAVSMTACKATDRGSADSSGTEGSTVSGSTTAAGRNGGFRRRYRSGIHRPGSGGGL